jgi:hypothetical protein
MMAQADVVDEDAEDATASTGRGSTAMPTAESRCRLIAAERERDAVLAGKELRATQK